MRRSARLSLRSRPTAYQRLWTEGHAPEIVRVNPYRTPTVQHVGRIALFLILPSPLIHKSLVATSGPSSDSLPWRRCLLTQAWEGSDERWLDTFNLEGLELAEADLALALPR